MTLRSFGAIAALLVAAGAAAQLPPPVILPPPPVLNPVAAMRFDEGPLTLRVPAVPNRPFTVTGTGGAILGMGDGTAELWQFPLKFFSGLHLRAEVDGYTVPIDLNSNAATLAVSPDHTTLTYSHAAITVRQHMFVPAGETNTGEGGVIVFEIESIRPATLTVSLTPAMVLQWPAPQYGQPGWDWQTMGPAGSTNGVYGIATDNPELFGVIGMPGTIPGTISPYQEHPRTLPLEFKLRYDPVKNAGQVFPLLCEVARPGEKNSATAFYALKQRFAARAEALPRVWTETQAYYAHYFDTRLTVETPDKQFDEALRWAELAIDKAQVKSATGDVGLVAGWYPSFDSARPGFGWYFGRDTLWSLYAVNSYGDAALTRRALDFLIKRQRADGKMMHEFSQTADLLTGSLEWSKLPYQFAAADSTPLFLLAMQDYVRSTGDLAYLKSNWESVQRAYRFERTHDSDGDGVYDNAQGTGWVEDWAPTMPHQEMYLAALDRDATRAMAQLAVWMGDSALQAEAQATAAKLAVSVENYLLASGQYAFSKNLNGTYDPTLTVYPAVALWGSPSGMAKPDAMLQQWSAHTFATDWGTRALASTDPMYAPITYHRGSVWPLFTGWTAMAEYRGGRPLAGYAALRQNVDLTWAQDPGAVTEVLSGQFYQPLGRSSTHQLWSSAMVLSPAIRGLFGLEPDAPHHTLAVHPHLPATWDSAAVHNVRVGDALYTVRMQRTGEKLEVSAADTAPSVLCLTSGSEIAAGAQDCREGSSPRHTLLLPLPGVEVQLHPGVATQFGEDTHQPRVIEEHYGPHTLTLTVEAPAGTTATFDMRVNGKAKPAATNATIGDGKLSVTMPGADASVPSRTAPLNGGFTTQTVTIRW